MKARDLCSETYDQYILNDCNVFITRKEFSAKASDFDELFMIN